MLGLGNNLISGVYVEETPFTTLGIGGILVASLSDEGVAIFLTCDGATVSGLGLGSFSENARVTGVTANVTVVHTHGDGGVELDTHVTQASKTLYAYKSSNSAKIYLANTDASTQSNAFATSFTASPFSGIDAVGSNNKYNITVNYIAKSGLTNSGSLAVTGQVINAA